MRAESSRSVRGYNSGGNRPQRRRKRVLFEALEGRRLMAADLPLYSLLPDGVLTIQGTPGDDQIRFHTVENATGTGYLDNPGFVLNGTTVTLDPTIRVRQIVVDAGGGNDVVDLSEGLWPDLPYFRHYLPATLNGGDGDDLLIGGNDNDRLDGGAGNDTLVGGPGYDTLSGDAGDDVLYGGMGSDQLLGGTGADQLYGSPSDDTTAAGDTEDPIQTLAWVDADGVLQVRGTPGDDVINVDVSIGQTMSIPPHTFGGVEVIVNGEPTSFGIGQVRITGINVLAGAGNDRFRSNMPAGQWAGVYPGGAPGPVDAPLRVTIDGGDGDDSLTYSASAYDAVTLIGGAGSDTLNGDAAADRLERPAEDPKFVLTPATEPRYFYDVPPDGTQPGRVVARLDPDGTLTVFGTGGDDVISVDYAPPDGVAYPGGPPVVATVNGWTQTFGPSVLLGSPAVTRIVINAGDGNDSVTVDESVSLPTALNGEAGDDVLLGGGGSDTLTGGAGDDRADGRGGLDEIVGQAGPVDAHRDAPTGTLLVHGTAGDDHIQVLGWGFYPTPGQPLSVSGLQVLFAVPAGTVIPIGGPFIVRVGDSEKEFGIQDIIGSVAIFGGDGNDTIDVPHQLATGWTDTGPVAVTIDGEGGDDTISYPDASKTGATLIGGAGDDTINGDAGIDRFEHESTYPGMLPPVSDPLPPVSGVAELPVGILHPTPVTTTTTTTPAARAPVVKKPAKVALAGKAFAQWRKGGVLVVRGTAGDDVIRVARAGAGKEADVLVSVNGATRAFRTGKAIRLVQVDAGAGDDSILLTGGADVTDGAFAGAAALNVRTVISGGRGDDTIVGGTGNDTIRGDDGNDHVDGGTGNDLLSGGTGVDTIVGGAGRDRVGGKARDLISEVEGAA